MQKKRGGRAWRRYADILALQVGDGLDVAGQILAHADADAGETAKFAHGLDILAPVLHTDRVFVSTRHHIDGTANQGLQRLCAAAEIVDRGLDAFFLEEAFALCDGERQIIK